MLTIAPSAGQRLRALDDQLHHAFEVHAGGRDVALGLDHALEPLAVLAQGDLGELALVDVLDHRDRRPWLALHGGLEPSAHVHPDDPAVLADVALVVVVEVALAGHQLAHELLGRLQVVGMGEQVEAAGGVILDRVAEHLQHGAVDLARAAVGARPHDADGRSLEDGAPAAQRLELLALGLKLGRVAHGG
jgi:hypothetical protein